MITTDVGFLLRGLQQGNKEERHCQVLEKGGKQRTILWQNIRYIKCNVFSSSLTAHIRTNIRTWKHTCFTLASY
jgi:hypothetical protein